MANNRYTRNSSSNNEKHYRSGSFTGLSGVENKYQQYYTTESSAHKLDVIQPEYYPEEEEQEQTPARRPSRPAPQARPNVQTKVRTKTVARSEYFFAKDVQHKIMPSKMIVFMISVVTICAFYILSVNALEAKAKANYSKILRQSEALKVDILTKESMISESYDLEVVKQRAIEDLGMALPEEHQRKNIVIPSQDFYERLSTDEYIDLNSVRGIMSYIKNTIVKE